MRKRIMTCLVMLVMILSLLVTACDQSIVGPGAGTNGGDVYKDYVANKNQGDDQFDFPGNYSAPELTIDGKGDDAQWQSVNTLATFGHGGAVNVKAYRGTEALFFLFEVSDAILLTEGNANDDSVTRSDSIEFYIDSLADGGNKPQNDDYQINLGIHGKTRIMQGAGSSWGNWNGLIDYEVALNGTLNDSIDATDVGYSVEVMVPYKQINIEKDSTIAISFGHVDKTNLGSAATIDWDWFGWDYGGFLREPQTPDNYVLLDKDNNLIDREAEERPDADMAGYVLDSITLEGVAGATVSVQGKNLSTTTDSQGYFEIKQVDPEMDYTVLIEKEGYMSNTATYTRAELRAANGGRVLKDVQLKFEEAIPKTVLKGTVKNLINGAVAGATIAVEGTIITATTAADGSFEIEGVPAENDVAITVSASGYGDSKTYVAKEDLVIDGDKITELGDVNIHLPYAQTGGFGLKSDKFADSEMQIGRGLTGIEMLLTGTRVLTGHIEIYLDTKECGSHREKDSTCWQFQLNGDGNLTVIHYTNSNPSKAGLEYDLYYNNESGYSARLFIPYEYLGITPLEVFGISLGQWSTSANDWDGWGYAGQFVAPETPETFIRVNATNGLYRESSNTSMVNLSGNTGVAGTLVTVGSTYTTTGANGGWSMRIPATSEEVNIVYSRQGYVKKTTTLPAGYFDTRYAFSENVTLELQYVTVTGKVVDSATKAAIAGATVAVESLGLSAVTNENGEFTLEQVSTLTSLLFKISATDYAASEVTKSAAELAEGNVVINTELISNVTIQYVTATGTVTNVNGPVAGATVTVEGNSALTAMTGADGKFTIENFAGVDCTVVVEKDGYISQSLTFKANYLEEDDTAYDFGTTDLWLNYKTLPGIVANKSDAFAGWVVKFTRSATAFQFEFTGRKVFNGHIEMFVDTGATTTVRDATDYRFNLTSAGQVTIENWGGSNTTVPADMIINVIGADTTAPVVKFTLPYSFLNIAATDVIGISLGQWSTTANDGNGDWDGWNDFAHVGTNGVEFVKPEDPTDYIRLGADNTLYAKADNVAVDFSSYQIRFGTGMMNKQTGASEFGAYGNAGNNADDFFGKVASRTQTGVTFEMITTGNFSVNSNTKEREMILIYFDKGTSGNGWDADYLVKIDSNGVVYGKAGAWWSATEADVIGSATITKENGVTKVVWTMEYTVIGVAADEIFGIAMREASHNAVDHMLYDPWHDCYFEDDPTGIDAAFTTQFIRVSANGTLYRAENNNPVA